MRPVGRIIIEAIRPRDDDAVQRRLAGEVREIVDRFPVPGLPAGVTTSIRRDVHRGRRSQRRPDRRRLRRGRAARARPDAARPAGRRSAHDIVDRPEARRVNTRPIPRGRRPGDRGRVPRSWPRVFLLLNDAQPLDRRCRSTIEPGELVGAAPGRCRRRRRSAPSTTSSTCAPAGSSSASSAWPLFAVALGIGVDFINNPFGAGRHPVRRACSRSASRSSGSSG